jgi:predicted signal transduction protein with EAL and GGDEF domain
MPSPGVFGRWGGDEFALLVPTHSAAEVATLVEGIRAGLPAGRTMSAGVGMWHTGQELSTVVQRADQALYEVKRSLRGVTQVFDEAGHGLLAHAVVAGGIEVHDQAVVDLVDTRPSAPRHWSAGAVPDAVCWPRPTSCPRSSPAATSSRWGTGYSSLSRPVRLPVDILEIDRSFVTGIQDARSAAPLVASVLALARSMAVRVVAEGVEEPAQPTWLRGHGCEEAQGFLWSAAVPGTEFLAGLAAPVRREAVAH